MRSALSRAAWVPDDDPQRPWATAASLAVEWAERRCVEEGADAVLVTNALGHLGPELEAFARRHTHTTRRAGRARVGPGGGPVLAYVPYADDLEFAMHLAHGSSLAVVETSAFPLAGWASRLDAWDLVNDGASPPLPDVRRGRRPAHVLREQRLRRQLRPAPGHGHPRRAARRR